MMGPTWCRLGRPERAAVPALQPAAQDAAQHSSISATVPGISRPMTFPRTTPVPRAGVPELAGACVSAGREPWPRASTAAFCFVQVPVQVTRLRDTGPSGSCISDI